MVELGEGQKTHFPVRIPSTLLSAAGRGLSLGPNPPLAWVAFCPVGAGRAEDGSSARSPGHLGNVA